MSPKPIIPRFGICEVCRQPCSSERKDRDICRSCYRKEPKRCCIRCGKVRHAVEESTGLCPRCASHPQARCSKCLEERVIYNQEQQLCKTCNEALYQRTRTKMRRVKRPCSVCGAERASALMHRTICRACRLLERKGQQICAGCGKLKVIHFEQQRLCKQCNKERNAKKALERYVTHYETPFPYNKELFDLLVTTIDWEAVTQKMDRKIRAFGRFLQTCEFKASLTWESIEQALPVLGSTHRTQPKMVRACLFDLGHLLAASGKLEKREDYIAQRNALTSLKYMPVFIQPTMDRYVAWLWEQQHTPVAIHQHLGQLTFFWKWCDQQEIHVLYEISPALINEYLLGLYWQWQCTHCQALLPFASSEKKAPQVCPSCTAIGSFTQIPRYAQNTVRDHRATLRTFFRWARMNRLIVANPVQRRIAAPEPKIQHYPQEVVEKLCTYILDPDADPVEALVLYLIIFHGLSVWELQHAEIPTLLPLSETIPHPTLDEMYYVIVPRPKPSKGNHMPGRPSLRLDFAGAAEPWLKPLLRRFEQQRIHILQNPKNRYLLVSPGGTRRRNTPVGKVYIWTLVRQASLRVLGTACNPNTLRKTAGIIFADAAGGAILRWMGWQAGQAFAYAWASREVIHPKNARDAAQAGPSNNGEIMFPPPNGNT
jgi:hypothetical protein